MNTVRPATEPQRVAISAREHEAATRYILAIIARDPHAPLNNASVELRTRQLWDQFVTAYTAVATGPYARRGDAALGLALGRL